MSALLRLLSYVRELVRRRRIEAEADEEVQFHIEMETDAHRARGLSDAEARHAALRDFGGVTQAREGVRAVRTTWVDSLWQDVRYAARLWRRQPAFTVSALLTLAIGIGVTTAIASAAYSVFLRPLPVHDEASLFIGYATRTTMGDRVQLSWPAFEAWRDSGVLDKLAALTTTRTDLTDGIAERIVVQQVTGNFFRVLGVDAVMGRVFNESDTAAAETPAVISDSLWRSRFAADANIVGTRLQAGRFLVTIVGVLPRRVDRWREFAHMWVPIEGTVSVREMTRGHMLFTPVARVAPERAAATADRLVSITAEVDGARVTDVRLVPLRTDIESPRLQRILLVLFAAVCLTWLVVCANLSNLLLARGPARAGELTIRLAIGATRSRIIRQLISESAVLAVPGGALGVWFAFLAVQWMASAGALGSLHTSDLALSAPVLWFACVLTVASVLACGVVPAVTAGRARLSRGAALAVGPTARRWSAGLVIGEIAVGLVVLVAATMLVKSVGRINNVDLGFDARHVLTFRASLPTVTYGSPTSIEDARYVPAQRALLERLARVPGVDRVSFGGRIFVPGVTGRTSVTFDDGREFLNGNPNDVPFAPGMDFIGPDYFAVHSVRIVRGREFASGDDFSATRVVIINEAMAAMHWPKENPLGRRLNFGANDLGTGFDEPWAEIIGVVADVRHAGIDGSARPYIYRAALQYPRREFDVMVQTSVAPASLTNAIRAEVRAFDPTVPMYAARPLEDVVNDASADVRGGSTLLASLAVLTVGLAGAGVFSLLACLVSARRRDLAIRVALGATPAVLARSVMYHAASMVVPGVIVGVAGAFVAMKSLGTLLYEVEPTDPAVYASATLGIIAVALVASYAPARRAALVDPLSTLKSE
jgi:putative ABC transport system permease protein